MSGDDTLADLLEMTAHQVRLRRGSGDAVEVPRLIDHRAVFRHKSRARAAGAELSRLGYAVEPPRRRWLSVDLEFTKEQAADEVTAAAFTTELHRVAQAHGGFYDGWGGFNVKKEEVPPSS